MGAVRYLNRLVCLSCQAAWMVRKEKTNCNTTLKELKELKYGWMDGIRVIWNLMLDISVFWNTCNTNVFCQLVSLWPNYLQASLPPSCLCWTSRPDFRDEQIKISQIYITFLHSLWLFLWGQSIRFSSAMLVETLLNLFQISSHC